MYFAGRRQTAVSLEVVQSLQAQKAHLLALERGLAVRLVEVFSHESGRRARTAKQLVAGVFRQHILPQQAPSVGSRMRMSVY